MSEGFKRNNEMKFTDDKPEEKKGRNFHAKNFFTK